MQHIHFIGIGGTGLSAIARVLLESGYTVSGSDRALSPLAQSLQQAGAQIMLGHQPGNIQDADIVIRSSAIPDDNPEVLAARAAGIPVLKRSDFLGQLMADKIGIAVAGSHGKTTTTAMITWMLSALGQDPTYIVGGVLQNLGSNAHAGKGTAFVIEADEYDRMFLGLQPEIMVITNVEYDHPDCFPSQAEYVQAFQEFCNRLKPEGTLIACADDPTAAALLNKASLKGTRTLSYAINEMGEYQARRLGHNGGGFSFEAVCWPRGVQEAKIVKVSLKVPGEHNVVNALAALAVADTLGIPLEDAAQALGKFTGTGRRFEIRGVVDGITLIDDYAHHPSEIRATLAAARSRYPGRRIWAVWQPHTYSRTKALAREFCAAFRPASKVIVTEIYAAREPKEAFSSASLVRTMDYTDAHFIPELSDVVDHLSENLQEGDVVLVLSAGDADLVNTQILERLQKRSRSNE